MGFNKKKRVKDFPEFKNPLNSVYDIENQTRLITSLPLSGRTKNAILLNSDVRTVEDLMELSFEDLMEFSGIGEKCLKDIDRCLEREQHNIEPPKRKKCSMINNGTVWWVNIETHRFACILSKYDAEFLRDHFIKSGYEVVYQDV